jgi:hypothetical protein
MTILDSATTSSHAARGVAAIPLGDSLWRVTRHDGEVAGYVERISESRGIRYRAKRFIVRQQRFVPIGDFWEYDDAMDCFRIG